MEAVLHFFIDQFSNLVDISLTASIVILVVIGIRQLLKRTPKVFSYALWGIVLLRLLVPISIESPVSVVPDRTSVSSMMELNEALPEIEFETPQDRAHNEWVRENTPPDEPFALVSRSFDAEIYLTLVWLTGIVVMLLASTVSYGKLRKRVRVCVPFRKGIYIADDISTPFVMGIFRPVIYLPGTLEKAERKYIIAHERHHIRRGDHIFKALGFLALTIHWFNPLVWVAFVLASRDMEMSCDEAVIRKFGEDVRADYSASLLNLATGHRLFAVTPLAFGEGNPTSRVRNLAKWKKPKRWIILICMILCVVLAACLLTDREIIKSMESPQETAQTIKIVIPMKKLIVLLLALACVLSLAGCSKTDEATTPTDNIEDTASTETKTQNEVLQFFADKYDMKFTLWGPEGQDLYAFYIYPNYAERECQILMPENTADVAEYHKDLSWEVVNDELIITGEWQESFKIDITAETATSTTTGKVYQIYEMQPPLE